MESTIQRNINSLPVEILLDILKLTAESVGNRKLHNCTLVCKSWLYPSQSVMYSNICISSFSQLEKFHSAVERDSQLGTMVKIFSLSSISIEHLDTIQEEVSAQAFNLFSNLLSFYLPNLEELTKISLETYIPILNALKNSRLEHLKKISEPSYYCEKKELINYVFCVILMRDRIERIEIAENFEIKKGEQSELLWNSLYDRLDQFVKLTGLIIRKVFTAGGIQILEHIASNCKSLKSLEVCFEDPQNVATSNDAISTVVPSYNLNSLTVYINLGDYKILWYIMHKFPKLRTLKLQMDIDSPAVVDCHMLTQLLEYSRGFEHFGARSLRIGANHDISETLGDHWKITSRLGKERLKVVYGFEEAEQVYFMEAVDDEYYFDLWINEGAFTYTFKYPELVFEQKYTQFIEKNGHFIGEIIFNFLEDHDLQHSGVPESCIIHTFEYCQNMKILRFYGGELKLSNHSRVDFHRKLPLDELHFRFYCTFPSSGSLECLSLLVPTVKRLRLDVSYLIPLIDKPPDIFMPNTKIESVIFNGTAKNDNLEVFVSTPAECYHYYLSGGVFKMFSEEALLEEEDLIKIYISCQTKPLLQLE